MNEEISYEYSLFMTDEGERATGCSARETIDEASKFLGEMLEANLKVWLKDNPNKIISLVIVTREQDLLI